MPLQQTLFSAEQTDRTSDDHYTPKWVFDLLNVTFDIDVAAPPGGIPWIPAKRYFTMADDGLSQPWNGLIWMNPPYSNSGPWVDRFIEHGNGICLLPLATSHWLVKLWNHPETRSVMGFEPNKTDMKFHKGDKMKKILFPVAFWSIGAQATEALTKLGRIR